MGHPGIAKTFRFKVIPDAETRYTALRAGEVQGLCDLGAISPSQAAEIDGDPAYNVSVGDSGITHFLNVNGGAFPFNDVRMREGLSLLLDRQTIIDSFYNGYGLAAGGFLNYTSAFYREQPVQHDPERGAELIREVVGDQGGAAVPAARRGRQPLSLPGGGRVHPVPAGEHRGY
ncbi:MAG: ABC transporter substrate-binding protein [Lawsonibacter sp.]